MRNLLDTVLNAALTVMIIAAIAYALLCAGAYTLTAAEQPLTKDEEIIAITLMGEARGEKSFGMYAVACVIQKRADERKLTPAQVCKEKWQFSCWNKGQEKNLDLMRRLLKHNTVEARYAKQLARAICAGGRLAHGITGNANHYYSTKVMSKPPYWAFKTVKRKNKPSIKVRITPSRIIGNHVFYKGL
jgi:spore germination cell wall hydrolase CwlJ-like protein